MAVTNKIVMTMETAGGDKNFSYGNIDSSVTSSDVKTAGQALVTNGSIFQNVPLSLKAAKLVTTTTTDYDLSD